LRLCCARASVVTLLPLDCFGCGFAYSGGILTDRSVIFDTSLQGVIPILCTPFDDSGEVDEQRLLSLVLRLLSARVHGIAIFGWGSEMYALSENERGEILRVVQAEIANKVRFPTIFTTLYCGVRKPAQLGILCGINPPPLSNFLSVKYMRTVGRTMG